MSNKIKSPNEKSNGFIWALVAILVIAVVIVGYIVYSSQGARTEHVADREFEQVELTAEQEDGAIVLRSANATAQTPEVELYEDFSCPYCGQLAEATDDEMRDAVEDGELVVHIRPLHFQDRENIDGHSHAALAASLAALDAGDTDLYWNFRSLLMEDQQTIANQWNNEDLANAAAEMGASEEVVGAINNRDYLDQADALGIENAEKLQSETGSVSSPRILQGGQDIAEDNIQAWVEIAKQG